MSHTNPVIGSTGWGTVLNTALDALQTDADAASTLAGTKRTAVEVSAAIAAATLPTSTTAALVAIANAVNTTGKYAGKTYYNTTTKKLVTADGATAGSVWVDATGSTAHTPA